MTHKVPQPKIRTAATRCGILLLATLVAIGGVTFPASASGIGLRTIQQTAPATALLLVGSRAPVAPRLPFKPLFDLQKLPKAPATASLTSSPLFWVTALTLLGITGAATYNYFFNPVVKNASANSLPFWLNLFGLPQWWAWLQTKVPFLASNLTKKNNNVSKKMRLAKNSGNSNSSSNANQKTINFTGTSDIASHPNDNTNTIIKSFEPNATNSGSDKNETLLMNNNLSTSSFTSSVINKKNQKNKKKNKRKKKFSKFDADKKFNEEQESKHNLKTTNQDLSQSLITEDTKGEQGSKPNNLATSLLVTKKENMDSSSKNKKPLFEKKQKPPTIEYKPTGANDPALILHDNILNCGTDLSALNTLLNNDELSVKSALSIKDENGDFILGVLQKKANLKNKQSTGYENVISTLEALLD